MSELEKRMKDLLAGQSFKPDDEAWAKMQAALQPPASRRVLLLFPAWKAAAAITGLVLLSGGAGYFLYKNDHAGRHDQLATVPAKQKSSTPAADNTTVTPAESEQVVTAAAGRQAVPAGRVSLAGRTIPGPVNSTTALQQDPPVTVQPPQQQTVAVQRPGEHAVRQTGQPATHFSNEGIYTSEPFLLDKRTQRKTPDLGIAANVGKPSLGDVQYNIGLVLRQDIAGPLFAEASVSLASTNVRYAESVYGFSPTGTSNEYAEHLGKQEVTMRYTNNIISVGFAPSIGIRATSDLSVSLGGDVYRSLNNALTATNRSDLSELISVPEVTDKHITNWDAGLKAQVDYRLGNRVSFSTQYRHGLTQFILVDRQSYKNSSFNVGVRYNIGR